MGMETASTKSAMKNGKIIPPGPPTKGRALPGGQVISIRKISSAPTAPYSIPARLAAENRTMREMWKRYEFIVNASRDFMNLIDRNYVYRAVNDAFLSSLNKTRPNTIGQSVASVWGRDIFESSIKPCFDRCFAGNIVHVEFTIDLPGQRPRYFHTTYYPYGNEKEITHAVVVSHDITAEKQSEERLRLIAEGTAKATGVNFFRELARYASVISGARVAFTAELLGGKGMRVRSLAIWMDGAFGPDKCWKLDSTPCADIINGNSVVSPDGPRKKFPRDIWPFEAKVESYLGIPFMDSSGQVIGYMGIIDNKPMTENGDLEPVLRISAARAGIELERERSEKQLKYMASHDSLTRLPNRSLFFDRLHQTLAWARRHRQPFAVLFIDLDDFKPINDNYGHEAGDILLRDVAQRLCACVREIDTVARMGGDEFTCILNELKNPADTAIVAKKILGTLKQPFILPGKKCFIGCSVGITIFPDDGADSETLVKNADTAMYRAKKKRNSYCFYSQSGA